jgi:hypothetical protein
MRGKVLRTLIVGGALALLASGIAVAEQFQAGKLILNVDGGVSPTTLPKKTFAPITLRISADLSTTDGSLPPIVLHTEAEFDKNGRQNKQGVPVCQPSKLENTVVSQARKVCKKSIVGTGFADAKVLFPGDTKPIDASSPITVFNGPGNKDIVHAYTTVPVPTTFVVPVSVLKIHDGRYGTKIEADVPPIAGGYGHLVHFNVAVGKKTKVKGKTVGFVEAKCPDGRLQAKGSANFDDGTVIAGEVFRTCKGRG